MREFLRGIKAIGAEALRDDIVGEAAKVSYYIFLSLWPLVLTIFAVTGLVGGEAAFQWIMSWMQVSLPAEATQLLERYVEAITTEERPEVLSIGILLLLWSGSNIFGSMINGLNRMYQIGEPRSWWKRKALSMGLLAAAAILLTVGATAILAGEEIARGLGLAEVVTWIRYPLAFLALTALLWLVYYYLPSRNQDLNNSYVLIGAAVGSTLWVLVTGAFRLYVANFGNYEAYGVVGSVMVLLLWIYLSVVAILFGGEVAVSLEKGVHRRHRQREAQSASGG